MDSWKEQLVNAILAESPIDLKDGIIEHQCGTVWIEKDGKIYALSFTETEE